jgi:hypothetical protein
MMAGVGAALLGLVAVGIVWPIMIAAPVVLLAAWIGIALVVRALELKRRSGTGAPKPEASRGWDEPR